MKTTKLILFSALLLTVNSLWACFNGYHEDIWKKMLYIKGDKLVFGKWDYPSGIIYGNDMLEDVIVLENDNKPSNKGPRVPSIEDETDRGIGNAIMGNYKVAKSIFLALEKRQPGTYNNAANLGTTYELLGMNDSALYWINKAIKINPKSHQGSEWIHVKILEAKIKADKLGKGYLDTCNVLGLAWGDSLVPLAKPGLDVADLSQDLIYQLNERLKFIKPMEPVMARLLFDLGCSISHSHNTGMGLAALSKAAEFGRKGVDIAHFIESFKTLDAKTKLTGVLKEKPKETVMAQRQNEDASPAINEGAFPWTIVIIGGIVLLVLLGMAVLRR